MSDIILRGEKIVYGDLPENVFAQEVLRVKHYTDRLFSFAITRPSSFRFRSGEFVMIGLPLEKNPIYRAYSIASPFWSEELEFFSIKVPNGPLTSHLQKIVSGDTILMRKKATGTLVLDALLPGKRLYLISTGTGVAPFASIIQDLETYEKFEEVVLIQTTRENSELVYIKEVVDHLKYDGLLKDFVSKLKFYPITTREASSHMGRITDQISNKDFFKQTGLPPLSADIDRVMICGSMQMIKDMAYICEEFGLQEGANSAPAHYVIERAFVN